MKRLYQWYARSVKAKLVSAFLLVSLVPLAVAGYMASKLCKDSFLIANGQALQTAAENFMDKVDRNLFERYGDVQAFAFNPLAKGTPEDISKAADFYMTAYGCYDLMLIADMKGNVVAANTVSFEGKPLDTSKLLGTKVNDESWFKEATSGTISPGQSYTADLQENKIVGEIYGNRGLSLTFAAPIRDDAGNTVGVWCNFASPKRTLEEIGQTIRDKYEKEDKYVDVTLFNKEGTIVEDALQDAILKTNLIQVESVKLGTEGKSGVTVEWHVRRKLMSQNGYAASKGYGSFPGFGWNAQIRQALDEALLPARTIRNTITFIGLGAGALIVAFAVWYGGGMSRRLGQTVATVRKIAEGDFSTKLAVTSTDEFGKLAGAVNDTADQLAAANVRNVDFAAKMAGISKAQAVIEFTMDGTISEANENFLRTVGYTQEEIKGKHHSMFVSEALRNSPEYRELWSKLNRGESVQGEFQRFGKGGKEVWLQASYNPIPDETGKYVKVVKYASEVTDTVRARMAMAKILEQVNSSACTLGSSAEELTAVSSQMASNAEETSSQANVVSAASEQVSKNVQTVSTGVEEMNSAIREIAKNATESARVAQQAVTTADSANTQIAKLGESSIEIGNVIKVITSIAEQTNLLALNATIEAARAGEAGKGFAVVANEVKELAKETARATEDIGRKIETIQSDTKGAVDSIQQISQVIAQINDISNTIASAVEEQTATATEMSRNVGEAAKGTAEIAQNITAVAQAASNTTQGASNAQQAASELARMATDLQKLGAGQGNHSLAV
ncbi:MAG: PAS domain S-box protein [Pirellulales bacterium]|nr:PAS domain S-box protein [Pirellulales bacterium]